MVQIDGTQEANGKTQTHTVNTASPKILYFLMQVLKTSHCHVKNLLNGVILANSYTDTITIFYCMLIKYLIKSITDLDPREAGKRILFGEK